LKEISQTNNPRFLEDAWISRFNVEKLIKKEVFGELFLIKMKSLSGD
jgi:hypothetical protein